MSVASKLNALLALAEKNKADAANYFGIARQSMANKFQRGHFSTEDLVRFCVLTDSRLVLRHKSGQEIEISSDDVALPARQAPGEHQGENE